MEGNKSRPKNAKKRNWAFFVYPDSAPADWVEQLRETGLQCAISPLHDKDLNPASDEDKKAHWHVIALFEGPTTYNNVKRLTDSLNSPIPKPLDSVRGYFRYFTHMDHPDKFQYDEKEIQTINGFNIADFVQLTTSEVDKKISEIMLLIREHGWTEYRCLMNYLQDNELWLEFRVARCNTHYFGEYIRGFWRDKTRTFESNLRVKTDPATGEVIKESMLEVPTYEGVNSDVE